MKPINERGPAHKRNRKLTFRFWILLTLLAILLIIGKSFADNRLDWGEQSALAQVDRTSSPTITVRAGTGKTIPFSEQKRPATSESPADMKSIPHLVLFRNGKLTEAAERTLIITVRDLPVPPSGLTLSLLVETQAGDPDLGGDDRHRIVVWQASQHLEFAQQPDQTAANATFKVEFFESIASDEQVIPTPTGYYRFVLVAAGANSADPQALFFTTQEYAFLLERQWNATLESLDGPRELVVYYCDMVPFRMENREASGWLPRAAVPEYVETALIPQMVAAVRLHTEGWGFSWEGWVSFSGDRSNKYLEVTLSDGETWYHGRAPERGLSSIAINVNGGDNAEYDTLTQGVMSTFHHELFHNFQRALALSGEEDNQIGGKENAWHFFSEGTAAFVPTVAQPEVQFYQSEEARAYIAKAVKFVGGRGFPGALNASYLALDPYNAAIYWRFLYEQCSGLAGGREDPAEGMALIRQALRVLYSGEIVDIRSSTDLVGFLPAIMDHVLSSSQAAGCPFRTYADSLVHFARAIYGLRLEGGRCVTPGAPAGCGFYDPNNLYSEPAIQPISYSGAELLISAGDQPHPAGIRSSFGMDFIEIILGAGIDGQSLTVTFYPDVMGEAEFQIQVIQLYSQDDGGFSSQKLHQISEPEILVQDSSPRSLTIPAVDLAAYDRLGLIITRLDAREHLDPVGAYRLVVSPGG